MSSSKNAFYQQVYREQAAKSPSTMERNDDTDKYYAEKKHCSMSCLAE
jgi:hypothetical protein